MADLYLGRPGTTLIPLGSPQPGADRSPTGHEGVHDLLGGGYAVDRAPRVYRSWQFDWDWDEDVWWQLSALYRHQYGPGPFALIDPAQINHLTAGQASGSTATRGTAGFAVNGGSGETLTSVTTPTFERHSRCLAWTLPATVTSGLLTLTAPQPLTGWPTPDDAWSFTAWCRADGTDTTFAARVGLRWLDDTGAVVSTSDGTYTPLSASQWTPITVTATPPAGGVYLLPQVQVDPTEISAAAICHLGAAQLQVGPPTEWRPGEGPALVAVARLRETALLSANGEHRRAMQLNLVELASEEE